MPAKQFFAQSKITKPDTIKPTNHNFKINYAPKKLNYPQAAKENHIQGTVILIFDIDSTCSLINIKVQSGIGYGCDEEALKTLPQFQTDLKKEYKSKCPPIKDCKIPIKFQMD